MDTIFYPCMSYNFDEKLGDNHYNCPVVAYYPEVLARQHARACRRSRFLYRLCRPPPAARLRQEDRPMFCAEHFAGITPREVQVGGATRPTRTMTPTWQDPRARGEQAHLRLRAARTGRRIIILAGRPYHIDPEINHGIDKLIAVFGVVVVTEDACQPTWCEQSDGARAQPVDLPRAAVRRGAAYRRRPAGHRTWCSWSPSAAAWTPSPPTRCARILESGGQDLHPDQDRRDHQPRRGQDPSPQPVCRDRAARNRQPAGRNGTQSIYQTGARGLYQGDARRTTPS